MRDSTGVNWLAHFLHGTSTMLRLLGPGVLTVSSEENKYLQSFFFSVRIFELSRALIYTEPTFLSTTEWRFAIKGYWAQNPALWTLKEALFDIIPNFSDLGIRTCKFVAKAPSMAQHRRVRIADLLSREGLFLQSTLLQWHSNFCAWICANADASVPKEDLIIAQAYYHTLSIYLDGIFSYHAPFTSSTAPSSPILHQAIVEEHMRCILATSKQLLDQGCAGLILFFPLRVAGARARNSFVQSEIKRFLDLIAQRGFSAAKSFVGDLDELWALQGWAILP